MSAEIRTARLLKQYERCKITKEELREFLRSGAAGRLKGVVGPFSCRIHKGRQIISDRALVYNHQMTTAIAAKQTNFAARVKFSKFLMDNKDIKSIWIKDTPEGKRAWNQIIKNNNITGKHPSARNIITPDNYHFRINNFCSLNEDLSITVSYIPESNEKLILILVPYNPVDNSNTSFEMLRIEGKVLTDEQKDVCRKYKKFILYSAVIRSNGEWSNTVVSEGNFHPANGNQVVFIFISTEYTENLLRAQRKVFYVLRL